MADCVGPWNIASFSAARYALVGMNISVPLTEASSISIGATLESAAQVIDRVDARLLLQHALGVEHAHLITHRDDPIAKATHAAFLGLIAQRCKGVPIAYITGRREFFGVDFSVTPAVLIPRPETELLVELALEHISESAQARILELGTGSGAIAISIAKLRPNSSIVAVDISSSALAIACDNAARILGLPCPARIQFLQSDWFEGLAGQRFDLVVCNPPYVADADPHLAQGDLRFEPSGALLGGRDGLEAIRSIVSRAQSHLLPGGWIMLEHGYDQAEQCRVLASQAGFSRVATHADLAGIPRVLTAAQNQAAQSLA
jgi:release factor glutamine methyltransferase